MTLCKGCGKQPGREVHLQEVLTMHIRGLNEKRVQALGERVTLQVCDDCLDAYVADVMDVKRNVNRAAGLAAALFLPGLLSLILYRIYPQLDLRVPGVLMMLVAGFALQQHIMRFYTKRNQMKVLFAEEQRQLVLPEYVQQLLPEKSGENNITYIVLSPELNEKTPARLVVEHKLLPEIAKQLHERLHAVEEAEQP